MEVNMQDITRRGVCYNLKISPYHYTAEGIKYFFSTTINREKFINNYQANRKELKNKFDKKLKLNLNANQMYDIDLYKRVESRGFYITVEGKEICLNTLTFVGKIKT